MSLLELDVPRTLPGITNFSATSIRRYLRCPESFRRYYIDYEREPSSGHMVLGSAVHAAEGYAYQQQVDGQPRLSTQDVLDVFTDAATT